MILDEIVADKKKRLIEHKARISEEEMKELAADCDRESISFYQALAKDGLSIIGEFKKASPSHGKMDNKIELTDRIDKYNASVDAISCLTEEDHFLGSVDYFKKIRAITPLPMIRKDFIIDPYQIFEAKVIGADCILLIAAILTDRELKMFYELAYALGMDVLVEVHDETEMMRAIGLDAKIIGVNNRNLKDFTIDLHTTKKLAQMMPKETILVSESGVTKDEDIIFLKQTGVDALLIGTVFMEAKEPELLAKKWKELA
ncbi:MAG: indole-3-glycerol phosphate synthase TrpC [Bacillus sp. (in: Bacteria)]|nr:indole-3-glycerol phosphate synthase TrpC [Bacillus sp. (in: firmicutes)]MCM1426344.1 indole-3-glycerol phosphate synthase TrpC [Eubacterium sp.]